MLGVRDLVEGEADVAGVEGGADEVAAGRWDVGVGFAEDLCGVREGEGLVLFGFGFG